MSPINEDERVKERSFRFKKPTADGDRDRDSGDSGVHRRHRYHRSHERRKRRKLSNDYTSSTSKLPPDVAFRESLFDALGDDEGADFWQGVYGQPIHTYSRTYEDADTGELGTMDDEQYATYVRRKMWEKSAEGLEAAREARRRERTEEEQRRRRKRREPEPELRNTAVPDFLFDLELDASLKRGQHRRDKKHWRQKWQTYLDTWKELQNIRDSRKGQSADDSEQIFLRNKIAWPVESAERSDVNASEVARFFDNVANVQEEDTTRARIATLKVERVRWHPDKIQQRFGFMQIDQTTMETVTAVFQIIDSLWNDVRSSSTHG